MMAIKWIKGLATAVRVTRVVADAALKIYRRRREVARRS